MSPAPRTALAAAILALAGLVLPLGLVALLLVALAGALVADVLTVRDAPEVRRRAPRTVARAVPALLELRPTGALSGSTRLRQPATPDIAVDPSEADERLDATLVGRRRGRHTLPRPAARRTGPLGLGRRDFRLLEDEDLLVYPDLPSARRLATSVRRGRFREEGRRTRGQLGLGTEFESIREYQPDDDIRRVNWAATERLGRPMTNQYRIEQDRDVVCVVDTGRLMGAPLRGATRLDVALDAVAAVAAVADELGDRAGLVAFDREVRRQLRPRRRGARDVVQASFDLEPSSAQSDYALAFHRIGGTKRAFVLVLTDLLEEAAAGPLVDAMPILARRHHVVVATATDPELTLETPAGAFEVFRAVAITEMAAARARAAAALRHAGAVVVEAEPERLGAACVQAYLRAKARSRL